MLPGFSGPEAKSYLPVFSAYAIKTVEKWKETISVGGEGSIVADVPSWVSRGTLDAIGEALENGTHKLAAAFKKMMFDTFAKPTKPVIFAQNFIANIPEVIREFLIKYMPSTKLAHIRYTAELATDTARALYAKKSEGKSHGKDIMSILVRANSTENEKLRLTDDEILGLVRIIIIAGHETTASTLSWMLLEISRQPNIQKKLRSEIREMRKTLQSRGQATYTDTDLDSMPYLNAVLKETLRCYPVAVNTFRQADRNDVLPLSKPITTLDGRVITELPIPKGLNIIASINGYNRNKEVFGSDADIFNPERWLNREPGVKTSIGWRFAVTELQAFIFELVAEMEFSLTPESERVRREAAVLMMPTVEGQVEKGAQLPLRIQVANEL
ncbi:hypothetical protein H0H92_014607 [Tricholoma furcatifolium]|nr:hypothetical protein H0H92_014607 [Tricholoma furcatifolium]